MNNNLISTFFEIIRFRSEPSSLPYSVNMFAATIVLAILSSAAILSALSIVKQPIAYSAVQMFVFAAMYYSILKGLKIANRFTQSAAAIFGVLTVFQSLNYIVTIKLQLGLLSLVITLWSIASQVYIINKTVNLSLGKAIFIFIGIQIVSSVALFILFPDTLDAIKESLQKTEELKNS